MVNKAAMSKRLLFLTPNPDHPSHHGRWPYVLDGYREALAGLDIEIYDQPWSEPVTEAFDLVTPLVAWGYHNAPDDFRAALKALPGRLLNPADIVGWNVDKRYLKDLAEAGVRIIPTVFVDRVTPEALAAAQADFGDALVLKPVFSAGAKNTLVWRAGETVAFDALEGKAGPPQDEAMIQPFMPAIQSEGEWSLLYCGGAFSHAVLKTPKAGDFRSQPDYDARLRVEVPPEAARALADAAIDYVGRDRLLYARADMVRHEDGGFCLMELELIEPDLYLTYDPEALMRFKDAMETALG